MAKVRPPIISMASIGAAGYKTALFSKPYFYQAKRDDANQWRNDKRQGFCKDIHRKRSGNQSGNLSSFEIETYIAFTYFNEQKPILPSSNAAWAAHR
jgi:folylpolyglutamate synthase/dihydropteroate synthase